MKNLFNKIIDTIGKTGAFFIALFTIICFIPSLRQIYIDYKTPDISGQWKLLFINESSSKKAYVGEMHSQKVHFTQNDKAITGVGEKWEYNGKLLPFDMHRKLEYQGVIKENCFKAMYKLFGLKRESSGEVDITISDDEKTMTGSFCGTAGDCKGTITGEKIN